MISELVNNIIIDIDKSAEEIVFTLNNGIKYRMYHEQDCCESVCVDDIVGDLSDLMFTPILSAYESSNNESDEDYESTTWTFYNLATIKGYVTITWRGDSNGYYSESVDIEKIPAPEGYTPPALLDDNLFTL